MKKQILLNIFSNYAGRAVGMLLGFFLVPFLIYKLGVEVFGLIVVFESIMKLMENMSSSVRIALSRYATYSLSQDRRSDFVAYLSTGRGIFYVISLLILTLGFAVSFWIPTIFRLPEGRHHECQQYFALITAAFAITVPNVTYWSGLYAKQRFDLINLASSIGTISRAAAIFLIFSLVPKQYVSLVTYGWVYLVLTWSQNYAIYFIFRRLMPTVKISLKYFQFEKVKEILSFSVYTLSSHVSSTLNENAINFMINISWGPAANAVYGVGCKFSNLIESIVLEPTWTLVPTFTDLVAKGEKDKLKVLVFVFTKAMTILCLPVFLMLMIFSKPILFQWVGSSFGQAPAIMVFSILSQCVYVPTASTHNMPNAFGKVKIPGIVNPVYNLLSVCVCYLFAVPLKFGLLGIAGGGCVCAVLMAILFAVPYGCYLAGFSAREFWFRAYFIPSAWAVCFWGPALWFLFSWAPAIWLSVPAIACLAGFALLYISGVYWMILDSRDKRYLDDFLSAFLKMRHFLRRP